jgi:predicted trehalose synthase
LSTTPPWPDGRQHVADGATSSLILLQAYLPNQGDAWALALDQLQLWLGRHGAGKPAVEPVDEGFLERMRMLARRTAELHAALHRRSGDAAFDPEPIDSADLQRWAEQVRQCIDAVARCWSNTRRRGRRLSRRWCSAWPRPMARLSSRALRRWHPPA